MNFIIILDQDFEKHNISSLNIITQNIKKFFLNSKINLLIFQKELDRSLLIDKEDYSEIIYIYNNQILQDIKRIKCNKQKNIIINLIDKFISKILNLLIYTKNKITHNFVIKNNNKLKIEYELEIKNKLNNIFKKENLIVKPLISKDKEKLKKTEKIINWNLTSSDLNKIKEIKFIFFYLINENADKYKKDIIKVAKLLHNKANLKMILTAKIDNYELKKYFDDEKLHNNIIDNFLTYDNKNFVLCFSKYANLIVTNDRVLNNYNNHEGINSVLIDKKTIKNKSFLNIKEKLLLDKKIDYRSKFEESIEYLINMI